MLNFTFLLLRLFLIPMLCTTSFFFINQKKDKTKKIDLKKYILLFVSLFFIVNILSWLITSFVYVKDIFFIFTKIFGTQRLFVKFTLLWIGLSGAISFVILGCYVLFCIIKNNFDDSKKHYTKALVIQTIIVLFISFFYILSFIWANKRFPLDDPRIVVETLSLPLSGADPGLPGSIVKQICVPIIIVTLFISLLLFGIKKTKWNNILSKKNVYAFLKILTPLSYLIFLSLILCIPFQFPLKNYMRAIEEVRHPKTPVFSEFYDKYYINPQNVSFTFPDKPRNLILIFLESIEHSFTDKSNGGQFDKDLIPELTQLCLENINFSKDEKIGGGITISGTYGTMAGIFSKTSGLPLTSQTIQAKYNHRVVANAITIFDILHKQGYNQEFLCGSDKAFASRGDYMESHFVEVLDLNYYKKIGVLPSYYHVNWGFEDLKLYSYAKDEATKLSSLDKPFMLSLLTVDTHLPSGYTCELCPQEHTSLGDNRFWDVVHCASCQANNFISWVKEQSWYDNTLIVIVGDHPFMNNSMMPEPEISKRYWLDLFINSSVDGKNIKNRKFSAYDIFPTIVAGLGIKIEGDKLGFGTNLFSDKKTLLEEIEDISYINQELTKKTTQYEDFQK